VKLFGVTETWFTVPQLSEPLWNTSAVVIEAAPAAFRLTEAFLHVMLGGVMSDTVTVAEQVAVLPLPSLAVKVTVFGPVFAQVKLFGVTETWFTVPQLSEPLWKTSAVVMEAAPAALRFTLAFLQVTLGGVTSDTVTVAVQVAVLPLPSLAVKVTVFKPVFAQVKLFGVTET
jgi:hypothetical protein